MRGCASRGKLAPMEQQLILHIVGGTSRSRAEQARFAFARGFHAEVYADLDEVWRRPLVTGLILAGGEALGEGVASLIDRLGARGTWLPVVATGEEPQVPDIVEAIREGALDFLSLPIRHYELDRLLTKLETVGASHVAAQRGVAEARQRIFALSRREREVLDWLCEGCSNKHIARALDISPRTVEIHRANMMEKLGAKHSAEAVRLQCIAGLESTARSGAEEVSLAAPLRLVAGERAGSTVRGDTSLRRAA